MNISAWLRELQLEEYAASFVENKIDPELLRQLTDDDLKALGAGALGDRKRLFAGSLRATQMVWTPAANTRPPCATKSRLPLATRHPTWPSES